MSWGHWRCFKTNSTGKNVPDYVDGGQDNLFINDSRSILYNKRHGFILYQPLICVPPKRLQVISPLILIFPMEPLWSIDGFDFTRATYMYDVRAEDDVELSVGVGIQIRNAALTFASDRTIPIEI